jgi:predicted metal-dependent hydrolase
MAELTVRRIPFSFDGVEFIWNPCQPEFSLLANVLSFQTIGFERFICRSIREALPQIKNDILSAELKDFSSQEMAHSEAHMKHVSAILQLYPSLQRAFDESVEDFDQHWISHDLDYRLAYSAIIEATSLPLYKVLLQHRSRVMEGGDPRVASLLLWHFCEEVEHCGSALRAYNDVVGCSWFRLKMFPSVAMHLAMNMQKIAERFYECVPEIAGLDIRRATASIPLGARIGMIAGLLNAQMPWYNPDRESRPAYLNEWKRRFEAGADMRLEAVP